MWASFLRYVIIPKTRMSSARPGRRIHLTTAVRVSDCAIHFSLLLFLPYSLHSILLMFSLMEQLLLASDSILNFELMTPKPKMSITRLSSVVYS